eukprot:COSAG01_NODE_8784_length_2660_cov_7.194846_2_plen_40_part_00
MAESLNRGRAVYVPYELVRPYYHIVAVGSYYGLVYGILA